VKPTLDVENVHQLVQIFSIGVTRSRFGRVSCGAKFWEVTVGDRGDS
jgi:hypothetical protein